jgi:hypothetical protein
VAIFYSYEAISNSLPTGRQAAGRRQAGGRQASFEFRINNQEPGIRNPEFLNYPLPSNICEDYIKTRT